MTSIMSSLPMLTMTLPDLSLTPKAHVPNWTSWWKRPISVSTCQDPPPAMLVAILRQSDTQGDFESVRLVKVEGPQSPTESSRFCNVGPGESVLDVTLPIPATGVADTTAR